MNHASTQRLRALMVLAIHVFAQAQAFSQPQQSLDAFVVKGWSAMAVAWEPQVFDPVAATIDHAGRLWVVEMRDYPFVPPGQAPRGRVILLDQPSATDRGAVYLRRTVFQDGLDMPTGIAVCGNGVVITHAGKLSYFEDTDGDRKADVAEDWVTGFATENEQLRANHPTFGLDGKWYVASGLRGGSLQVVQQRDAAASNQPEGRDQNAGPVDMGSRDLRFSPELGKLELITGASQFGMAFDAFGNRYSCSNRNPAIQFTLEQNETNRNIFAGIWPDHVDRLPSGDQSRVFPIAESWTTSNLHAGQYTAACSLHLRGLSVGPQLTIDAFVCEPTASLVTHSKINWDGSSGRLGLVGEQLSESAQADWLASSDAWFRPVNLSDAPGGGLIVVDMHRAVIEHPHWVPEELRNRPDQSDGSDLGRIYCFERTGQTGLRHRLRELARHPLDRLSSEGLARLLVNGDDWTRGTAARLMLERVLGNPVETSKAIPSLQSVTFSKEATLSGRAVAIRLLVGLSDADTVGQLFGRLAADGERESMMLCSVLLKSLGGPKSWLPTFEFDEGEPPLWTQLQTLREEALLAHLRVIADGSPLSSELHSTVQDDILELYKRHLKYLAASELEVHALGGIVFDSPTKLLEVLIPAGELRCAESRDMRRFTQAVQAAIGSVGALLSRADDSWSRSMAVKFQSILAKNQSSEEALRFAMGGLAAIAQANGNVPLASFGSARRILQEKVSDEETLAVAARLLALDDANESQVILRENLGQGGPLGVAVWKAWHRHAERSEFVELAIDRLDSSDSVLRETISSLVMQPPTAPLVEALLQGRFPAGQLGIRRIERLADSAAKTHRGQLLSLAENLKNPDRQALVREYAAALSGPSSVATGKKLFAQHCSSCHRIRNVGTSLGPEISDTRTKKPIELLTAILNPNLAVDSRYFRTKILTQNGQVVEGLVTSENATSVVVKSASGEQVVVQRDEIDSRRQSDQSLMPEGFENSLSKRQMASLISFLKNWRYIDGQVPGLVPERR